MYEKMGDVFWMDHFQVFLKVLKAMEDEGVDYILIGGFAVILHGLPRFTMDMDFFHTDARTKRPEAEKGTVFNIWRF